MPSSPASERPEGQRRRPVYGAALKRNFPGMERPCSRCEGQIVVTEVMCKRGNYRCGKCESEMATAWGVKNRARRRALNSEYAGRHRDEHVARTRQYREAHPERAAARQAVQTAVRNGSLARLECEVCGEAKSHAHHDDYSKPLEVRWLCHEHHMEHHWSLAERARRREGT